MATTSSERWVWMDLEMTGLDDTQHTILEAAVVVTDPELRELATLDVTVWQPESVLDRMGPFVRKMHTDNGLLARVRTSENALEDAERKILEVLTAHVPFRKGVLAGNSVWQDRRFLLRHMPHVENYLHYRQIDVSTVKVLANAWYGGAGAPQKQSTHTALSDIRDSIAELKHYRARMFLEQLK